MGVGQGGSVVGLLSGGLKLILRLTRLNEVTPQGIDAPGLTPADKAGVPFQTKHPATRPPIQTDLTPLSGHVTG